MRYWVLFALAMGAILSYLLRVSISTAGTTIQRELSLDDVAMGDVFGAFFWGYLWVQLPAGWVGYRTGARAALTIMGALWGVSMVAMAAAHSFGLLYASRVALGAAQAGLFAVTIMAVRDWFPTSRRGFASSVITSCMSVGAVLASGLTVRLLLPLGWRGTFLLYALLALGWALVFLLWFRNTPDQHKRVNAMERELIAQGRIVAAPSSDSPHHDTDSTGRALLAMAKSWAMWALCIQSFFQAFAYAFFITWFPAYLEKGRGVKLTGAGDLTMLPLFATVVGSFLGGYLADAILIRTGNKWLSRCGVAGVSLGFCAVATLAAAWPEQASAAVWIITIGMLFSGLAKPMQWAVTMDLTGRHSAVGFAVMNIAGNFGALACPKVIGRMIDNLTRNGGDWNSVLYLIVGINLAGAVAWLVLNPSKPAVGTGS